MFPFIVRTERAWSAVPVVVRLAIVAAVIATLVLMSASAALAAEPRPFRWS